MTIRELINSLGVRPFKLQGETYKLQPGNKQFYPYKILEKKQNNPQESYGWGLWKPTSTWAIFQSWIFWVISLVKEKRHTNSIRLLKDNTSYQYTRDLNFNDKKIETNTCTTKKLNYQEHQHSRQFLKNQNSAIAPSSSTRLNC